MAEGDGALYNNFKEEVMEGNFDLLNDTIKIILVTGHAPDIDTDTCYADVIADEEAGAGYVAGGKTLAGQAVTQDNANDRGVFDGDNVTWVGLDVGVPSHAIMYDDTIAAPVADLLIAYWEVTTASNGGDYTLQWHANGIILLT